MNEITKTSLFLAVAVVVVLTAIFTGPSTRGPAADDERGQLMFPDFKEALAATSLEIISFDEKSRRTVPFLVAQVENRWSIPSHENYPADAENQLAEAATSMMRLKIRSVASEGQRGEGGSGNVREIHNLYGVVDPESAKPADKGVGTRVTMKDKSDNVLMSLVIGEELPDQSDLRYVRRAGKDRVYVVKVDTGKLSTKFEDWIEEDLLKLNTWDLKRVNVQDYSVGILGGRLLSDTKGQMTLEYDDAGDPKWKLTEDLVFQEDQGLVPGPPLADDEELDTDKLNDLKNALDDLKIVDVQRKPPGLSADLKAPGGMSIDLPAFASLQQRGFYLAEREVEGRVQLQLLSNKGEIRVVMKDGVEYVLRFGEIAGAGAEAEKKDDAEKKDETENKDEADTQDDADQKGKETDKDESDKADDAKGDDSGDQDKEKEDGEPGMNRYLFVMAEFNPDTIAKPELETPPDVTKPAEEDAAGAEKPDAEKSPADPAEADPADAEKSPADPAEADPAGAEKSGADPAEADPAGAEKSPADPAEADPAGAEKSPDNATEPDPAGAQKSPADPAEADPSQSEASQSEASEGEASEGEPSEGIKDDDKKAEDDKDPKAERERIEKENKRKQEEYQEKIDKGQERVEELNARFADWYYVISDEVYRKIHLGRDQIVKKKEKDKEGDEEKKDEAAQADEGQAGPDPAEQPEQPAGSVSEFNKLKQEGPSGSE